MGHIIIGKRREREREREGESVEKNEREQFFIGTIVFLYKYKLRKKNHQD